MSDLLKLSIENHVATIAFNNPPANTWTYESLSLLKDMVLELNNNKDVYALVVTGEGEKFFQQALI
jgi:enoyl-CoA hydratase/carnithine racemase